ncbi:MAG TPA: hypothetical protein VMW34_12135 [Anaerolineales bacterium]|nr:hypothetical protein [Anaerolineales bacterium]
MTEKVETKKKPKVDKYPGVNEAELKALVKEAEKHPGTVPRDLLENAKGYLDLLAKEK